MNAKYLLLSSLLILLMLSSCKHSQSENDSVFQTSTINALLKGYYDGEMNIAELKEHGNFGIGTFNSLDGEMIALNGIFYQVKSDGIAYFIEDTLKTPFACVTNFDTDKSVFPDNSMNYEELVHYLDSILPGTNIFYAIKIEGKFHTIKTRSVPRQSKPYHPLIEIVKNQPIFNFNNVQGTLVGFRYPGYMNGINVPGYHFHFITTDKKKGGHVLDCSVEDASIAIDCISNISLSLPESNDFLKMDLTGDKQKEVEKVEK